MFLVAGLSLIVTTRNYFFYKQEEDDCDEEFEGSSYNRLMSLGRMITCIVLLLLGLTLVYNGIAEYYDWKKVILP